jgi:hypothetical protein
MADSLYVPNRPTLEGLRRFPETDGYYRLHGTDANKYPCRCAPTCADPCDGRCGCFACRIATVDRLSRAFGAPPGFRR